MILLFGILVHDTCTNFYLYKLTTVNNICMCVFFLSDFSFQILSVAKKLYQLNKYLCLVIFPWKTLNWLTILVIRYFLCHTLLKDVECLPSCTLFVHLSNFNAVRPQNFFFCNLLFLGFLASRYKLYKFYSLLNNRFLLYFRYIS